MARRSGVDALVVGAGGQVGCELVRGAPAQWTCEAVTRSALDITDAEALHQCCNTLQPRVVINAAGYTAVDRAETETELAFAVNALGAANVARTATAQGARIIHISTDFVFDGMQSHPYLPKISPVRSPRTGAASSRANGWLVRQLRAAP